jgi:hypothetical protein
LGFREKHLRRVGQNVCRRRWLRGGFHAATGKDDQQSDRFEIRQNGSHSRGWQIMRRIFLVRNACIFTLSGNRPTFASGASVDTLKP